MLIWFLNNLSTILVGAVLAAIVIFIVIYMTVNKNKGKSLCGCGCQSCAMKNSCHKSKRVLRKR